MSLLNYHLLPLINVMRHYLSFPKLKIILAIHIQSRGIHHPRLKESLPGSQNIISKKQTVDQVRCSSSPQYCWFLVFFMFCQGAGAYKRPLHAELQNVRYIRVKILAGWGKSLGEHANLAKSSFWREDLYNIL